MRSLDPLGGISVFIKVAETLNLSRAAEQMGLSKATISGQLKELEAKLGVRLFHRNNRTVVLTEAGEVYKNALAGVVTQIGDAEREAKVFQEEAVGHLRVSAPPDFGQIHLPGVIADFIGAFPEINVQLELSPDAVDLVARGFDLAVRLTIAVDDNLIVRRLASAELIACASPTYLSVNEAISKPADLSRHPSLHFAPIKWGRTWHFKKEGLAISVQLHPKMESNDSVCLRECAIRGAGVTLLPDFVAADALSAGTLVRVLADWHIADIPVHAIYPANRHIAPKVRLFVDFLAKSLKASGQPLRLLSECP